MFFTYLRRELLRRRRQALVVALGLGLGIGLVITVTAVTTGVRDAQATVLHSLYGVGTDITVTQTQAQTQNGQQGQGGPQSFNLNPQNQKQQGQKFSRDRLRTAGGQAGIAATSVATIAKLSGVSDASGGLTLTNLRISGQFARGSQSGSTTGQRGNFGGQQQGATGTTPSQSPVSVDSLSVAGVDATKPGIGPLSSSTLSSGRAFTSAENNAKVAIVSDSYATQNKLKVGSNVTVAGTAFPIVGIATAPTGGVSSDVYLPLTQAQTLSDLAGKVTTVYVKATGSDQIAAVKSEIQKALPKATVTTSSDLAGQVSGSLSSASSLATNLGRWLAIAVLIAAFLLAGLFTISAVNRRTGELGTLKAIGWRSRRVIGQIMGESLIQGLIGGVVGIVLGLAGSTIVTAVAPTLSATLGGGNSGGQNQQAAQGGGGPGGGGGFRRFAAAAQTVDVHLSAPVTLGVILLAVGLAVAGGLVAGTLGGWRAARMRPSAALRQVG
jgi:ABC-type lipoprotein release transport system permease subunit